MNYKARYIQAVIDFLPARQREEVRKEVDLLICDLMDQKLDQGLSTEDAIVQTLSELGSPAALAERYKEKQSFLIGPALFDLYKIVLQIVMVCTLIGVSIGLALKYMLDTDAMPAAAAGYLGAIFSAIIQSFAWVTIVFAIMEYANIDTKSWQSSNKEWTPDKLPPVTHKSLKIHAAGPIIAIIFLVLFTILATSSYQYLGILVKSETNWSWQAVSFFNEAQFKSYLPMIWIVSLFGLLIECMKLLTKKWTPLVIILQGALTIAASIAACVIFSDSLVWNQQFISELANVKFISEDSALKEQAANIWSSIQKKIIPIVLLFGAIDFISLAFKWVKYTKQSKQ